MTTMMVMKIIILALEDYLRLPCITLLYRPEGCNTAQVCQQ